MKLQQTAPGPLRRTTGRLAIAAFIAGCGYGALAAHAGVGAAAAAADATQGQQYQVDMEFTANGEASTSRTQVLAGVPFAVVSSGAHGVWRGQFVLTKASAQSLYMKALVKHDERIIATPSLLFEAGQSAAVAIQGEPAHDNFKLVLTAAPLALP